MALLESSAYHGRKVGRSSLTCNVETLYADGLSIYEYTRSNPVTNSDPLGLFVGMLSIACPGPSDMITGMLKSLVSQYGANLEWDVECALDWSLPDDAHSRMDNTWITLALAKGVYDSFEIGIPFTDIKYNPLDAFANSRAPGNSRHAKRLAKAGIDIQSIRKVVVPNPHGGTVTILKYRPTTGREIVRYPREVVVHDKNVPVSTRSKEKGDANEACHRPRKYDWTKELGEPHIWHHGYPPGRMQLVPEWVHQGPARGHQGRARW
ncbi:MAG: hypothetical protein KF912_10450 [Phycisphaeraceae bacterium]|nr:hypothetical protein [Phycisphaeraceae bacterium]MBX3367718.1 hypothetical protein [Phycisphaeraceae bacterium]